MEEKEGFVWKWELFELNPIELIKKLNIYDVCGESRDDL